MIKAVAFAALAALFGADAFVSPVATSFSGSAVAQRVSLDSPYVMYVSTAVVMLKSEVLTRLCVFLAVCSGGVASSCGRSCPDATDRALFSPVVEVFIGRGDPFARAGVFRGVCVEIWA